MYDEEVKIDEWKEDYGFYDEIGGYHSEGLGWNPQGVFCGECSSMTCIECSFRDEKDDD